ncbi:MAG TPA: hypothetical protein VFO54_10975, partial [Chryseosolibacter sp.]|nr:hypothetical protein [Chryseosolibacter sp.]
MTIEQLTKRMLLFFEKWIYAISILFVFIILSHTSFGQLQRHPIGRSISAGGTIKQNSTGRTKQAPPLVLPFFEDFSKPFKTGFADTSLWENNFNVWINDGMGVHPPTINVATFDALDSSGVAYNANDVLLTGYTDTLTSKPIDLSESNLSLAERPTVYLSFFYQWQGNVEAPDENDFLQLDFKTAEEGGWKSVMTIFPKAEPDATVFYDTIIRIAGDEYFHDRFQFRFRSFGRLSGPYDTWHVDYIYINKNRNINDMSFPDRALSTQLGPLFG